MLSKLTITVSLLTWNLTLNIVVAHDSIDDYYNEQITNAIPNNTYRQRYTIDELLNNQFPRLSSNDFDLDICKATNFLGDIALPNIEYETKWRREMVKDNSVDELEKIQEEVMKKEGLQIEEESLTKMFKYSKKNTEEETSDKNKSRMIVPQPTTNHQQSLARRRRGATARKERLWDHGVIPYEIDYIFSGEQKALFKEAMRHWENFTCIKFVEREIDEHPNYIVFTERPCGCCSFVGKRGNGPQGISIGKNCDRFGVVVHELGHAIGFWHEHTRPDRDRYVQIIRDNIKTGQEHNFNEVEEGEVDSLGFPYDYDSIMHYSKNTFSKETYLDTVLPIEMHGKKRPEIGQRIRLSEGDIAQTNSLYKCDKCGRTFQESSGSFSSPSHPISSPGAEQPERCEWRITGTYGEHIVLNITSLDIFQNDNCRTDYLEIRDGYWHKSPVLGRYCGSGKIPDPVVSSGNRMLVTYVTSPKQSGHAGFNASYETVCGGDVEVDHIGRLASPNYPEKYQSNKECIWKVSVPQGFKIALNFLSFKIESHDKCIYDYVEVRDGYSANSTLIGIYCGDQLPADINSVGNKLFVKFVSDSTVEKTGFSAMVIKVSDKCALSDHGCEHGCINTLSGFKCTCKVGYELHSDGKHCEHACGGIIEASNGTITSPSFPDVYPMSKHCVWKIIAPTQYRITLNFTHFDLEGMNEYVQGCSDWIEISSSWNDTIVKRHGFFCGSKLPPMITSEVNELKVLFSSDITMQKSGFAAIFFTKMDECANNNGGCQHECKNTIGSYHCSSRDDFTLRENGHDCKEDDCKYEITAPTGTIYSPNFPNNYPKNKDCVWHFTTTPGHRIKLIFNFFNVEPRSQPECEYDYVAIYDGDSPKAQSLGRFCGYKEPQPTLSTGNQLLMTFKSDYSITNKGFYAEHTTVCGGHLTATDKTQLFYSHACYGKHNYSDNMDCDWTIEAPIGRNVYLSFDKFDLEEEKGCSSDWVEVYSGLNTSSPTFGKFCGNSTTSVFISNEALLIRFKTDNTITRSGFMASYFALEHESEKTVDG